MHRWTSFTPRGNYQIPNGKLTFATPATADPSNPFKWNIPFGLNFHSRQGNGKYWNLYFHLNRNLDSGREMGNPFKWKLTFAGPANGMEYSI